MATPSVEVPGAGGTRRALIVEAGAEIGALVREGIAAFDPAFEVDRVDSVNAAVDRLTSAGYDLIVSDDELDGTRAGHFLRHLCERRFPAVPFVLLSSGVEAGEDEPDEALLAKPVSAHQLRDRIARLLGV